MDKTEIIEILNDWNYWNRPLPVTRSRPVYDNRLATLVKMGEVTVIKGIRRSGKSTLMINLIKQLLGQGVDKASILFVNLEDPRFINHLDVALLEKIKETYLEYLNPQEEIYIFLDEVQNIPDWEKWVNKEYELRLSHLCISGSNSSLLSSEIGTALSGRYVSVDVYPLSFKEYVAFQDIDISGRLDMVKHKIVLSRIFERYLKEGGFPKLAEYDDAQKKELLISYKDSIMLKDIVARYSLKEYAILEEIAAFLLSNTGISQSVSRLKNSFHISYDMAKAYLEYLIKAYMVFEVPKFDYSLKKQNINDKKYYSIDLGLSNLMRVPNLKTRGSDLETVVFLELLRKGYKVYYYKTSNGWECDFVAEKDMKITALVQVTVSINDPKTYKRELRVFERIKSELQLENPRCIVISEDNSSTLEYEGEQIECLNIKEWLLGIES